MKIYSYSKQTISSKDIKSVIKTLNSKFLTQGPTVEKFENKIKGFVKSKYGVAVNSATSGLHLACLSLGLQKKMIIYGQYPIVLWHLRIVPCIVEQMLILLI